MLSVRVLLGVGLAVLAAADSVTHPWPAAHSPLNVTKYRGKYSTTGRAFTAYLAVASPADFAYELMPAGCTTLHHTSTSAAFFGCTYATNAGCVGNVRINGTWVQAATASKNVFLGTRPNATVVGVADQDALAGLDSVINGAGWLVRAGHPNVAHSPDLDPSSSFVLEKAPRTGLAVDAAGRLMSLLVDGDESLKEGADLNEFAALFVSLGAVDAINLDGGGSSTAVYKGEVYNYPTCVDTPVKCQRKLTTIACFRQPKGL